MNNSKTLGTNFDPICILLVKNDSKGHKLLFRYPYSDNNEKKLNKKVIRNTPYSLLVAEDPLLSGHSLLNNEEANLTEFSDELLSTLFAVSPKFVDQEFELKINDIKFIGYPTIIQQYSGTKTDKNKSGNPPCILVHVIFALNATADSSVVKSYHDFSKRLGIAIRHEEKRCGYFVKEMKLMMSVHENPEMSHKSESSTNDIKSSFDLILDQCSLAKNLKLVYDNLCSNGIVNFRLNNWILVSFCLTQKAHLVHLENFTISPEEIDRCLQNLKPYHGILLLQEIVSLLNSLPPDASPSFARLLKVYSPLKNFQTISADSDLPLAQVYKIISHFLYWGSAMIIYPLCESNTYVIAPGINMKSVTVLTKKFSEQFPDHNLKDLMTDFSLPCTMMHKSNALTHPQEHALLAQMVAWMLRHRLLMQLHTYIFFMPTGKGLVQFEEMPSVSHSRYQSLNTNFVQSGSDLDTYSLQAPSDSDLSSIISEDYVKTPMTALPTELNSWLNISVSDESERTTEFGMDDEFITSFTEEEKVAMMKLAASSNQDDLHLLIRLLKQGYLNGSTHLEEIMYLENIRRSQLVQLIEKFRDVMITCEFEDPAVAFFYPKES